jgi:thioredoxin 1
METQQKQRSFSEMIHSDTPVLVDFYAEWCGPCKMMKPILEEVKHSLGEKVKILKVDVDKNTSTASSFRITGVPTLILFKQGKEIWRRSGVVPPAALTKVIESYQ